MIMRIILNMNVRNSDQREPSMNSPDRTMGPVISHPSASAQPRVRLRRIESRELLGPGGQIIIDHGGEDYRLRITSNGKLLLTK